MLTNIINKKNEDLDYRFIAFYESIFKNRNKYFNISKKFFCFKNENQEYEEDYVLYFFKSFFDNFFTIKNEINTKKNTFYLYLYLKNNYKTYRFFFGYPNNQKRTRCNFNSTQNKKIYFRNYLVRFIYNIYFNRVSKKK